VLPAVAGLIIGGLSVVVVGWNLWTTPAAPTMGRFGYELPAGVFLFGLGRTAVALSPDGSQFAFATSAGLYLRSLGELDARVITGAEGTASSPFFSPDGQSVGYFEGGQLRRISVNGGASTAICAATDPLGATWGRDNVIFFAQPDGIMRVSADGGTPEAVIKARTGEVLEGPQLLPDSDWLLFSLATSAGPTQWDQAQVVVESLRTGERKVIWRGGSAARYLSTGHLVYVSGNTLYAAPFDTDTLEIRGRPLSVIEGVMRPAGLAAAGVDSSAAQYAVSDAGTLVYAERSASLRFGRPVWVGRDGVGNEITTMPVSEYPILRLSPDQQSLLTIIKGDLWIYDIATGRSTRLTQHGQATGPMAWHPSGEWVAYTSAEGGNASEHVWMIASDGGKGTARQLTKLTGSVDVDSWSPDGRVLGVHHHRPDGGMNILMVRTDTENSQPETFVENEVGSEGATFSPDGRHVAYMARDTGQGEIYIRSYPNPGGRRTVSVGGGREPVWGRSGELFYRNLRGDRMMVVDVTTEPSLKVGKPQELFARQYGFNPSGSPRALYDVTHDGQRFLMLSTMGQSSEEQAGNRFIIVQNWGEELKRLAPVN
jgi:Tol biopolymer transport system component